MSEGRTPEISVIATVHEQLRTHHLPPSLLVDADNLIVDRAGAVERYLQTPTDTTVTDLFTHLHLEVHEEVYSLLLRARDQQQSQRSRPLMLGPDTEPVILHIHPAPLPPGYCLLLLVAASDAGKPSGAAPAEQLRFPESAAEKYRILFNSIDEGFCIIELLYDDAEQVTDCRFLEANPAFVGLTGRPDIVGRRLREVDPQFEAQWFETFGRVARSGQPERFTLSAHFLGNRWHDIYAFSLGPPDVPRIAFTINDISRQQAIEQALRDSEGHYRNVLESIPAGVILANANGQLIYGNPEVERIFQAPFKASRNPLEYGEWPLYRVDKDEPFPLEQLPMAHTLYAGEAVLGTEMRIRRPDGSWRYVSVNTAPIFDTAGKIILGVAAFIDITERRISEQALRESEERYRTLFESIEEGFCVFEMIFDEQGTPIDYRFLETNPSFEQQTGLVNAVGKTALELVPNLEDQWVKTYGRVALSGQAERFTMGSEAMGRWFEVEAFRVGHPSLHRVALLFSDITERKRTAEDLQRAKEKAEQAASAKEDFLAHMSHEIRTPLNSIIGFTNLLLEEDPQPEQLESLQILQISARNLRALIDDILDFSKIQAGQLSVQEEEVDLHNLLDQLEKSHKLRAREQQNQLLVRVDERIPASIRTDRLKLSQILQNLISNAVKFTHGGTVTVTVDLRLQQGDKLWLDFAVTDTGIGIPADKIALIFDAFSQVDTSTARLYEGTGLGLSITRSLLDLLGSQIEVESEAGRGSRFFFTLPVQVSLLTTTDLDAPQAAPLDLRHLRVLLAEDIATNRAVLRRFLHDHWGIQLDEATNGREAVELAERNYYHLILMDIRMPVMDGYQAARAIRTIHANTPIIALTADTREEVIRHSGAQLFVDIITKPFDPQELRDKIAHHGQP